MPQPDSGNNCCDCPSRSSPCDNCGSTGACCFPDNTCVDTTESGCTGSGVFQGAGIPCSSNPCDLLHIGCCNNNDTGECTVTLDTDCFSPFAFTEGAICCFGDPGLSYCCDFTSEICCGNAGCCNSAGGETCCGDFGCCAAGQTCTEFGCVG